MKLQATEGYQCTRYHFNSWGNSAILPILFGEFKYEVFFLSRGWRHLGPRALQDCDAEVTQEWNTSMFMWEQRGPESLLCGVKVVWPSEVIQPPGVLALQAEECLPQNKDDEILSLYTYVFMGVAHMCHDECVEVIEHLLFPHGLQGWNWGAQAWLKHLY